MTPPVTPERLTPEERAALQKLAEAVVASDRAINEAVIDGSHSERAMELAAAVVDAYRAFSDRVTPSTLLRLLAEIARLSDEALTKEIDTSALSEAYDNALVQRDAALAQMQEAEAILTDGQRQRLSWRRDTEGR